MSEQQVSVTGGVHTSSDLCIDGKTKSKKTVKVPQIYVPRRGSDDWDDDDWAAFEPDAEPAWRRHFTPDELLGRYEPIREIGRGQYGVLYEGKVTMNRIKLMKETKVAIKKVRRIFHIETDAKGLLRELRILRILRNHDSIVTMHDIVPPEDPKKFAELTLIFEFCDADLSKIFRTNQFFTTLHVQYMLYQVLCGVKHMHSAQIAHRDLKPSNILINEDCSIKICDFGLARGVSELSAEQKKKVTESQDDEKKEKEDESNDGDKPKKKKKKLLKKKKMRRSYCRRFAVIHWYRSPEVILLQQKPETLFAADIWAIGAMFAELLQMQRENRPDPTKRGPIFPGDSCFPLQDQMDYASRVDQMQFIFDIIGSPTEEEIAKITDEKARKYLRNLPQRKRKSMSRMFPGADAHAQDLLLRLLMFDVDKRITIDEALDHHYFKAVRDPTRERVKKPVTFQFECTDLGPKKLRELILEEVLKYNKCHFHKDRLVQSGAMPNYKKRTWRREGNWREMMIIGYSRAIEKELKLNAMPDDVVGLIFETYMMLPCSVDCVQVYGGICGK